jgi:hypothetical protein
MCAVMMSSEGHMRSCDTFNRHVCRYDIPSRTCAKSWCPQQDICAVKMSSTDRCAVMMSSTYMCAVMMSPAGHVLSHDALSRTYVLLRCPQQIGVLLWCPQHTCVLLWCPQQDMCAVMMSSAGYMCCYDVLKWHAWCYDVLNRTNVLLWCHKQTVCTIDTNRPCARVGCYYKAVCNDIMFLIGHMCWY